jgi:hypothetical protein
MEATRVDALVETRERLTDELAAMPLAKQGTPWHLDRVNALRAVVAEIEAATAA